MKRLKAWSAFLARTPFHPQWLLGTRRIPEGVELMAGRLLDIGSADRWIESRLPPGLDYVALDYPSTGRDLYGGRPDVFADAAELPFPDNSFDAVLCLEVIEHVPTPARVMAEIARVLKPGGRAWLSMPFLYPVHDAPHDFQRYTGHGWHHAVADAGLVLVSICKTGHSIRTAGLLACLSLAGGLMGRHPILVACLLVPTAALVFGINCVAWLVSLVWPDWDAMGAGYSIEVSGR